MANYSLVTSGTTFNPTSFQDMWSVASYLRQQHDAQEEALSQLSEQGVDLAGLEGSDVDSDAYNIWKQYQDDISKGEELLRTKGFNDNSRAQLMKLRRQYAHTIKPLEKAYQAKQDKIKEQQTNWLQNKGRVRYSIDARNMSVNDFMGGKSPEYKQVNLDDLYKEAATSAAAKSSRYFATSEGQAFGGMYKKYVIENGIPPQEAINILANSGKYPEFAKLKEQLKSDYNFDSFTNKADLTTFDNIIERGITDGIVYKKSDDLKANANFESYANALSRKVQLGANYGVEIDSKGNIVPVTNEALKASYENKRKNNLDLYGDPLNNVIATEEEMTSFNNTIKGSINEDDKDRAESKFKVMPKTERDKVLSGQLVWDDNSGEFEPKE